MPLYRLPALHRALNFTLRTAFGFSLALVVELFALAEAKLDLYAAVLEIDRKRYKCKPVLLNAHAELLNLTPMHQKTLWAHRIAVKNVALFIGADVQSPGIKLAVFDGAVRILE